MGPDSIKMRAFSKLEYGDPKGFLEELSPVDAAVSFSNLAPRVKHLRTNSLKPDRERRDAAIFCIGMEELMNTFVRFSPVEEQDYDFVATWESKNERIYCPVQLKELVSSELNCTQSMQDVLSGLSKYTDSIDLTVAIKFSRVAKFDPTTLQIPHDLRIAGLWVFGAISQDQSNWGLWGDFAAGKVTQGIKFQIPR
jgi:hypothetical protein